MNRTAFLAIIAIQIWIPVLLRAQGALNDSEAVARRATELRDSFARDASTGLSDFDRRRIDREVTVRALLSILEEESAKERKGAISSQVLKELANYPENYMALRALVANIHQPTVSGAPFFTSSPLEHHIAAQGLIQCGNRARPAIYAALSHPQTERRLHIMAYVLAQIDQDKYRNFSVEVPVLRLTREIRWVYESKGNESDESEDDQMTIKNLRSMIDIMLDPKFALKRFPDDMPPLPSE
jgi:hypothetical protein